MRTVLLLCVLIILVAFIQQSSASCRRCTKKYCNDDCAEICHKNPGTVGCCKCLYRDSCTICVPQCCRRGDKCTKCCKKCKTRCDADPESSQCKRCFEGRCKKCYKSCVKGPSECYIAHATDYHGNDLLPLTQWPKNATSYQQCADLCLGNDECLFWKYDGNFNCWLKDSKSGSIPANEDAISGDKACGKTESSESSPCKIEQGIDYFGYDLPIYPNPIHNVTSYQQCANLCQNQDGCLFWKTDANHLCWLKSSKINATFGNPDEISGNVACGSDCRCPLILDPVCGYDGKTYPNDCVLKCNNARKKCNGKCPCQHQGA